MSISTEAANAAAAAGASTSSSNIADTGNIEFKAVFTEIPVNKYKFAEIYQGRIVSINEHFMPIGTFRQLFDNDRQSDFVDILPAEKLAGFTAQIGDIVSYNDGTLTITRPVYPDTLEGWKNKRLDELTIYIGNLIVSGFTSSCTGTAVRYDSDKETQLTMQGIALNAKSDEFSTKYPQGCPVRGYVGTDTTKTVQYLTGDQVLSWCADLSIFIGNCKLLGWQKQAEINACTSIEAVKAVTW